MDCFNRASRVLVALLLTSLLPGVAVAADEGRFQVLDDAVVLDRQTGLMWMRCSLGQRWENGRCVGTLGEYSWDAAHAAGTGFSHAGFDDWRLPEIDELRSLIHCSEGMEGEGREARCRAGSAMPTIDTDLFPDTPDGYYWSATPFRGDPRHAWIVLFRDGGAYDGYDRDWDHHVRLVRGGR